MKASRITGEQALKLSSGTTSSWKEIIKNGKSTNLLTHNFDPEDEPMPALDINKPLAKATQTPYQ